RSSIRDAHCESGRARTGKGYPGTATLTAASPSKIGFCREGGVVRIIDVRETVVPIKSEIRNAYIDFSQMTVSVLALVTDVVRQGKPVVGFGFSSNGRY